MARVAVLDTSSILWITDAVPVQNIPEADQESVFDGLTKLVVKALVVFPRQVTSELARPSKSDPPYLWAKANYGKHPYGEPPDILVKEILREVSGLLDPSPVRRRPDDADPYVVAQGVYIKDLDEEIVVVTEDTRYRQGKTPISSACDHLDLPWLRMEAFLKAEAIWPRQEDG